MLAQLLPERAEAAAKVARQDEFVQALVVEDHECGAAARPRDDVPALLVEDAVELAHKASCDRWQCCRVRMGSRSCHWFDHVVAVCVRRDDRETGWKANRQVC